MWKQQKRTEDIEEGLRVLQGKFDTLEGAHRNLKLEYVELYDKVMRQMSRMAKRYEVDQKELPIENEPTNAAFPLGGSDPISRSIMLRRARQFGPVEGE